jgi:hypothetical protein
VWWIKYSRNGKPFRESAKTTDKRKAEALLKVRLAAITSGTFAGLRIERVRIEDLAEDSCAIIALTARNPLTMFKPVGTYTSNRFLVFSERLMLRVI